METSSRYIRISIFVPLFALGLDDAVLAQSLTLEDIEGGLSARKTEAQKSRFWRESENRPLEISGIVEEAEEAGIILPAIVTLNVKGSEWEVQCWLRDSESNKIYDISIGQKVTCMGIFQTYSEFLDKSIVVGSASIK